MQRNNNNIPLSIAICNFHNAVDIRMNEFSVLENKKLYSKTSKLQFSAGKRRWNIYAMHFSQNEIYLNLLEFQRTKCKIVSVFWFLMRKNCFSTVRLCFVNTKRLMKIRSRISIHMDLKSIYQILLYRIKAVQNM